jgi:hypothetical protein
MRIFWVSFFVGAVLALGVELRADDKDPLSGIFANEEKLPKPTAMPIESRNATSSVSQNRVRKSDIIHASRVERAKQVAQNHLEIEMMARWRGINTARPLVNAGIPFSAPYPVRYVWIHPYYPVDWVPAGFAYPQ